MSLTQDVKIDQRTDNVLENFKKQGIIIHCYFIKLILYAILT